MRRVWIYQKHSHALVLICEKRPVTQLFDASLKPSGLRATQFSILTAIAGNEMISIPQLADRLVMERTTLTGNLRPLEKRQFIVIIPGEDQRVRKVALTAKGRQSLERAFPLWEKAQTRFLEAMCAEIR